MYSTLNPLLKDHRLDQTNECYIAGTYRMKFIKRPVEEKQEDTTPVM